MKFLIWAVVIFVTSLVLTAIREAGILLGAIPVMIIYGLMFWAAGALCKKYDERKGIKNKPAEEIDVDRHKDSDMLGKTTLTPFCTNHRYQNKDWATIELFLCSTLCGQNREALNFKYQTTTTAWRAAGQVEVIYIFDSFLENGEKYSDLYVCDEAAAETTVPPIGYRFTKDIIGQDTHEATKKDDSGAQIDIPAISEVAPNETNSKTCKHCGSPTMNNRFYCPKCGRSIHEGTPDPAPLAKTETKAAPEAVPVSGQTGVMQPEIRFCRKCGAKLIPGSMFCSQCGSEIQKG